MSRLENSAVEVAPTSEARQSLVVLRSLLGDHRAQLLHDIWTLHFVFAASDGPWRRAGFASRVLVRAAVAEMDRIGGIFADPLEAAFWILNAQRRLLNHDVVDERTARALFAHLELLRPSQQRAARSLLRCRSENLVHPEGTVGSNLLLISVVAGGLSWIQDLDSFRTALELRFGGNPPLRRAEGLGLLRLDTEERLRLDERALAFDLAHRLRGQAP